MVGTEFYLYSSPRPLRPTAWKSEKKAEHKVKYEQGGDVDLNLRIPCVLFHILLRAYNTRLCASLSSAENQDSVSYLHAG